MKRHVKDIGRRCLALGLVLALAGGMSSGALAAGLSPVCDESYYATLDYYGGLMDSSVVKSYLTNGQTTLTDYGSYEEVVNLTDDRTPAVQDGAVTFELGENAPARFYFEGKTARPFEELPWTFSLSYRLNGAPILAEDLAGKTGLVEINLDVLPNPNASEYSRNNLVLTAATAFNADEILSLEAEGAELQLIGNLRTVLFLVLPGEEQHFSIKVGSDDFSFPGMVLLVMPATLAQLDQVADLREAKEKAESSYDAINESLDAILNALDGMSGSLNATANGLDQLNSARGTVSAGKGGVYDSADAALQDLNSLADALAPLDGHLDSASQALTDVTATLTGLTGNVLNLKPELEAVRKTVQNLQEDADQLRSLAGSAESYQKKAATIAANLEENLNHLGDELNDLEWSTKSLKNALNSLKGISQLTAISVGGMTTSGEVRAALAQATSYHTAYQQFLTDSHLTTQDLSFESYLIAGAYQAFLQATGLTITQEEFLATEQGQQAAAQAKGAAALYAAAQEPGFDDKLDVMDTANSAIPLVNDKIKELNKLLSGIATPTASVIGDLSSLCNALGDERLSDDLSALAKLAGSILKDLKDHEGDAADLLDDLDGLGDLAVRVSKNGDAALELLKSLDDTLNTYQPKVQQALTDSKALSDTAQAGLRDTHAFLSSAEALLRQSGQGLDAGAKQTLSGLADALRQSTSGLNQSDNLREAKNNITGIIDDEWDAHAGGENNLLLIDPGAAPVSLTSAQNGTPSSIQYIMRTQEIKAGQSNQEEAPAQESAGQGTFWSRVGAMFRDFWSAVTGIFHKK